MYMYVCKQSNVLCETKDTVTVENSKLPGYIVKILKILIKFQSSRCFNLISYHLLTLYQLSLLYTGLCQKWKYYDKLCWISQHKDVGTV